MDKVVLLDSNKILIPYKDNFEELLLPFLHNLNCQFSDQIIHSLYNECCSGKCSTDEFWSYLLPGIDIPLDMIFAKEYQINIGAIGFLKEAFSNNIIISCICNDNSEWVTRVYRNYALDYWIKDWLISSELGILQSDKRFFKHILNDIAICPENIIYVSHSEVQLNNAFEEGIQPVLFGEISDIYPYALTLEELPHILFEETGTLSGKS